MPGFDSLRFQSNFRATKGKSLKILKVVLAMAYFGLRKSDLSTMLKVVAFGGLSELVEGGGGFPCTPFRGQP